MGTYNRKMNSRRRSRKGLWILIAVLAVLLTVGIVLAVCLAGNGPEQTPTGPDGQLSDGQITPSLEVQQETDIYLGYGLTITQIGSYTGAYVEDGSDTFVSGALMLRVTNTGEQDIQYAEIAMPLKQGQAAFSLSTLPVGGSVILLEQTGLQWDRKEDYAEAILNNPVAFDAPLELHADQLKLQKLSGGLNVTNISGQDITGDIVIYYKNAQEGLYYGGITYRVRLTGGIKAGQIQQIMADHFSAVGSEVMFITIG